MNKGYISLEIYVRDVSMTVNFLVEIFGFEIEYQQEDFANIWLGRTRLILNELKLPEFTSPNPVLNDGAINHLGSGSEIVISVENLEEIYDKVQNSIAKEVGQIKQQKWGLRDFRFLLPDGYYIRVTEPDERVKREW
jgi:catechol 2,3-dioxygenase-like lactoylglutathione lyase family enzyme